MSPNIDGGVAAVAPALILRRARLADGRTVDVHVADQRITSVVATTTAATPVGTTELDLDGYLLLPSLVEPHAHLDKAYTAHRVSNPAGDLAGAIRGWLAYRASMSDDDIVERATTAMRAYLASGVTVVRSHVDIGADIGLRGLGALARVRHEVRDEMSLQLVAFVSTPLAGRAGDQHRGLLRQALDGGADLVGACPNFDEDPLGCVEVCLDIAGEYGVGIDLHVDENLDPTVSVLSLLADRVERTGFAHRVSASHCVNMSTLDAPAAAELAQRVARAGISVICLPATNLYLQARDQVGSVERGLAPTRLLSRAGVVVAAGGDNLQDPFNPLGRADPLETAALLVYAGHQDPAWAYAAISRQARVVCGLSRVEIAAGSPAEMLAIRADSVRQAIAEASPDRTVIHNGRIVARTGQSRTFHAARQTRGEVRE